MEDLIRAVGEAAWAAVPTRLQGRWDTLTVEATRSPADSTCAVTAACQERGTGARHPVPLGPAVADRFADLRAEMAADGQEWKKAVFQIRPDRRFELDFEYE